MCVCQAGLMYSDFRKGVAVVCYCGKGGELEGFELDRSLPLD